MGRRGDLLRAGAHALGISQALFDFRQRRAVGVESPLQQWNYNHNAVFVHIPKSAGQSLKKSLGMHYHPLFGHCAAAGFRHADPVFFKQAFVFAFVREPLARLNSAFRYLTATTKFPGDRRWAQRNLANIDGFEAFVDRLNNAWFRAKVLSWIHFRPQSHFLTDKEGNLLVRNIFHFEHIEEEFGVLCRRLKIKSTLRHINAAGRLSVSSNLSGSLNDTVRKIYADDYALLGY